MRGRFKNLSISIGILLFSVFFGFIVLEISARIIWKNKYNQWLEKELHGYEHVDYDRSIIIPNANTTITVELFRKNLEKHGKKLGLKTFEESSQAGVLSESSVLFRINKYGFKGPEISIPKPQFIYRILTIGNSCTWGPANDYYSYPRTLERELNRLTDDSFRFEVVNAGFMGYNLARTLKRINEFLKVEPDMVTIYLGWNRTIGRADPRKSLYLYRRLALYKIYYHFIVNRKNTGLDQNYNIRTFYQKDSYDIGKFISYSFKYDMSDLDYLVKVIKRKNKNINVIIITLAGLFDWRVEPDERALNIAYPTASTNNLYAYPLLTKKYNDELKKYAARQKLDIIDFETYALRNFVSRSKYFHDSVHLTNEGYLKMGEYFAKELITINNFKRK